MVAHATNDYAGKHYTYKRKHIKTMEETSIVGTADAPTTDINRSYPLTAISRVTTGLSDVAKYAYDYAPNIATIRSYMTESINNLAKYAYDNASSISTIKSFYNLGQYLYGNAPSIEDLSYGDESVADLNEYGPYYDD